VSGLFRRLAGQALGETSPVRPRSSARFQELVATPQGDEATSPPELDPLTVTAKPQNALGSVSLSQRERSAHERTPRPDEPRATGSRPASAPLDEPSPVRRPASPPAEPPLLLPLLRAEPGDAAGRIAPARAPADPKRPVAMPSTRSELRALSAERVSEPNEVHVHIGRIEVTAVHDAPRKRESTARPASSRRLEEYLRPRGAR
jgi:hypothetical protein